MCMSVCLNAAYTTCVQCHRGQTREAVMDSCDSHVLLGPEPVLCKSGQCSELHSQLSSPRLKAFQRSSSTDVCLRMTG